MSACLSPEGEWTSHLPQDVPILCARPGSGDWSGLRGQGTVRKEAEAAPGGRVTVAMEGTARYSGICILTAEDRGGGGGLEKVMGKPVSFFCPWHFLHPGKQ